MARSWLIDCRGLAKKVINAGLPAAHQIKDCGAFKPCPNCNYLLDNSDVPHDWPGLPAGIKFDPSDVELLDHLAAKQGAGKSEPHVFIDDFIPTLEDKEGICCTHPENLPGAKKDGSSVHFFYRISNAYASGRRKLRRVHDQESAINSNSNVRWHKTGKTKPVMENGVQKGFKKIMVLYAKPKAGSKPEKCNWVMHQYHLGTDEDEKEGEYVVSKISYQPDKATDKAALPALVMEESVVKTVQVDPMTPKTTPPDPPRQVNTPYSDCLSDECLFQSLLKEREKACNGCYSCWLGDDEGDISAVESLLCNEAMESCINIMYERDENASCGIGELDNLELDTPPDFHDLQFASQDSVFDCPDRP